MSRPFFIILGPTAVGKTETSLVLAEKLGAEIVSADAFQVYRGMDIATAKPSSEQRKRARHHLIDILEVGQSYSAARFRLLALQALRDIDRRGKIALVVGGAGLYLKVLTDGIFPAPPADPDLRRSLSRKEEEEGEGCLHRLLSGSDPAAAARIHPRDHKRLVRALEVLALTGRPISDWQKQWPRSRPTLRLAPPAQERFIKVGLRRQRDDLSRRIERRVQEMIGAGLVEETKRLLSAGADQNRTAWQALGYREVESFLKGECVLSEAARRLACNTRRYARRQMIWFRREEGIRWFDLRPEDGSETAAPAILKSIGDLVAPVTAPTGEIGPPAG